MPSTNVIKIVAAFLAGVIVALGSALIFLKSDEMIETKPAVETAATVPAPVPMPSRLPDAGGTAPAAVNTGTVPPAQQPKLEAEVPREPAARKPVALPTASRPRKPVMQVAQNRPALSSAPQATYPTQQQYPAQQQIPAEPPAPMQPATPAQPPQPNDPNAGSSYTPSPYAALPPRQPRTVTIPAGTDLPVRLSQQLTSDRNQSGDTFRATLENPIILEGAIIADRGSRVVGRVVTAQKAGRVEGVADLTLALTEINTTDGQRVSVATNTQMKTGPKSTKQDAAKIGGGAALGAIIGAIAGGGKGAAIGAGAGGAAGTGTVLATRGKAAVLESESRLNFRLSAPVTITERLNSGQ